MVEYDDSKYVSVKSIVRMNGEIEGEVWGEVVVLMCKREQGCCTDNCDFMGEVRAMTRKQHTF